MYLHLDFCIELYAQTYPYVPVYMYTHVYVYIHVYIYIYIYMHCAYAFTCRFMCKDAYTHMSRSMTKAQYDRRHS